MPDTKGTPTSRQRVLALVSLVAAVLLAASLIGFLVRNGVYVAIGLAGLAVGVAGGWWAITKRASRRVFGTIAMVAGAAVLVASLLGAGNEDWPSFVRALLCLGLLAITIATARAAFAARLRTTAAAQTHPHRPSLHTLSCCAIRGRAAARSRRSDWWSWHPPSESRP